MVNRKGCVKDFQLDLDKFIPQSIAEIRNSKTFLYLSRANEAFEMKKFFDLISNTNSYASLTTVYGGPSSREIPNLCYKIWQLMDIKNNQRLNEICAGFNCLSSLINIMLDSRDHYWMEDGRDELTKLSTVLNFIKIIDLISLFEDYFTNDIISIPKNGSNARQSYIQSLIRFGNSMRKVWVYEDRCGQTLIKHISKNIDFSSNKIYFYFHLLIILCPAKTLYGICLSGLLFEWWDKSDSRVLNSVFITLLERASKFHRTVGKTDGVFDTEIEKRIPMLYQMLYNYCRYRRNNKKNIDEFKDLIPARYNILSEKSTSIVRKITKIIVNSKNFTRLNDFISAVEPYAHPLNGGFWSLSISDFFQTLFITIMKIKVQSKIINKKFDIQLDSVLQNSYNIALVGMMSKNAQISSNYLDVLKRICYLSPNFLPKAIDKLLFMMNIVDEPQSGIVAMRALSQLTPLIVKLAPDYITTILDNSVNSISPSDPLKSSQALFLSSLIISSMRSTSIDIYDINENDPLNDIFNGLLESKINNNGFIIPERLLFDLLLGWAETAQFPQKSAPVDQGVITIIRSSLVILFRFSDDVDSMADQFLDLNITMDNLHFGTSVGLALAITRPKIALRIFKTLSNRVIKELRVDVYEDIAPRILVLSSLIRCLPECFRVVDQVISILDICWDTIHKSVFNAAVKLAQRCLESAINIYPINYTGTLKFDWYFPKKENLGAVSGIITTGIKKIGRIFEDGEIINKSDSINRAYTFLYRMVKAGLRFPLNHQFGECLFFSDKTPHSHDVRDMIDRLIEYDSSILSSTHGKLSKLLGEIISGGVQPIQLSSDMNTNIMDCVLSVNKKKGKYFFTGSLLPFSLNVPFILISSNLIDSLSIFSYITKKSHMYEAPIDVVFGLIVQRVSDILNHHRWFFYNYKLKPEYPTFGYISKLIHIAICGDEKVAGKAKSHLLISMAVLKSAKSTILELVFNKFFESTSSPRDLVVMNTIKFIVPPLLRRIVAKPSLLRSLFLFITSAGKFEGDKSRLSDNTRNALILFMEKTCNERLSLSIEAEDYMFNDYSILNASLLIWINFDNKIVDWLLKCIKSNSDLSLCEIAQSLLVSNQVAIGLDEAVSLCLSIASRRKKTSNLDDVTSKSPYIKLIKSLRTEPLWIHFRYCRMGSSISLQNIEFLKYAIKSGSIDRAIHQMELVLDMHDAESDIIFIELFVAAFDLLQSPDQVSSLLNRFIKNCRPEYLHDLADAVSLTSGDNFTFWRDLISTLNCQSLELYRRLLLLTVLNLNSQFLDVFDIDVMRSESLQVREQFASLLVSLVKMGRPIFEFGDIEEPYWDGFLRFGIRLFTAKKWSLIPWITSKFLDQFIGVAFKCLAGREELKILGREALLSLSECEFGLSKFDATAFYSLFDKLITSFQRSLRDNSPQSGEAALDAMREFWLRTQFLQDPRVLGVKLLGLVDRTPPDLYKPMAHLMSTIALHCMDDEYESMHFIHLAGLIYSFPYSTRGWTPRVLTALAIIGEEGQIGDKFIKNVIQDFFKTHTDSWNEWRNEFTREQLDIIEAKRGRPICSAMSDFDEAWNSISLGLISRLEDVLDGDLDPTNPPRGFFTIHEQTNYYTLVYNLCTRKDLSYEDVFYRRYREVVSSFIRRKVKPVLEGGSLPGIAIVWVKFKIFIRVLSAAFSYLDRFYVELHGLPDLKTAALMQFKKIFLDYRESYSKSILDGFEESRGDCEARSDLAIASEVYTALDAEDLFKSDIESKLMHRSYAYYDEIAKIYLAEFTLDEYLVLITETIKQDVDRAKLIFGDRIMDSYTGVIINCMIKNRLRDIKAKLCEYDVDNKLLYEVLSLIPEGVEIICEYITLQFESQDQLETIDQVINLANKYQSILNESFSNDENVMKAIRKGLSIILNMKMDAEKSAQNLAHYISNALSMGDDLLCPISLVGCLERKDTFIDCYRKLLAIRLLNSSSLDNEIKVSQLFELNEFTCIEDMIHDITKSNLLSSGIRTPIFTPFCLSYEHWSNLGYLENDSYININLHPILNTQINNVEKFYLAKLKHRSLIWIPTLGRATLCNDNMEIECNLIQATILLHCTNGINTIEDLALSMKIKPELVNNIVSDMNKKLNLFAINESFLKINTIKGKFTLL